MRFVLASLFALALLAPAPSARAWSFGFPSGNAPLTLSPTGDPPTISWIELNWELPAQLLLPTELGIPQARGATIQMTAPPSLAIFAGHSYTVYDVLVLPEPATALLLSLGLAGLGFAPRLGSSTPRRSQRL